MTDAPEIKLEAPMTVMRPGMVLKVADEVDSRPRLDPVEEVKFAMGRIESGAWTLQQACVALGVDFEEVALEIKKDRERMRELGLVDPAQRKSVDG